MDDLKGSTVDEALEWSFQFMKISKPMQEGLEVDKVDRHKYNELYSTMCYMLS